MKRTWIPFAVTVALLVGAAIAGPIKVWSSGDVVLSTDLNANFQHIHDTMVGAHGARLVNGDISGAAAISHTKMATPALIPKSFAIISGSSSTIVAPSAGNIFTVVNKGISITPGRLAAGRYSIVFPARPNANYAASITTYADNNALFTTDCRFDSISSMSTTTIFVRCTKVTWSGAGPAATATIADVDTAFTVTLLDDDN